MTQYSWATCPEAVREQIVLLQDHLLNVLEGNLIGLYLHGSLAFGSFNPVRSDIDLLVVTARGMELEEKRRVVELLLHTSLTPQPIEISFLVEPAIYAFQHPLPFDLHYSEDWRESFHQQLSNDEWLHWNDFTRRDHDLAAHVTVTLARGVYLYGKPIREALPAVAQEFYIESIVRDFEDALQNIARMPVYFVLNSCRIYAYLRSGDILSKDEGASWALRNLSATYSGLIEQAQENYRSDGSERPFNSSDLDQFAIYIQEQIQNVLS